MRLVRVMCDAALKKPDLIRLFLCRTDAQNAQAVFETLTCEECKMAKTHKATCWFCNRDFIIRDGREWKYLCLKCFHYVYEILKVRERPLELKNNWSRIMRRHYAENPDKFYPDFLERLNTKGAFKK